MPEFVKVELSAGETIYHKGTPDDCTHVVLTREEYQQYSSIKGDSDIVAEYQKQIGVEKEYNRNLIRIATERANRKSGTDKDACGYLILRWRPVRYVDRVRKGIAMNERHLFSVTLQTPLDCSLPLHVVDTKIQEALESGQIMLLDGQDYGWYADINNRIQDSLLDLVETDDGPQTKIIVERRYQSNVSQGYWEVEFITNFEPQILGQHRKSYI